MNTRISAHAAEIQLLDSIMFSDLGQHRQIEVKKILRDIGKIHVWADDDRVVTFNVMHPVEILR